MSSDLQLTADILISIKDKVLQDFEALLTSVHTKMKAVDKEAKDMLSGLPKENKVNKILREQGNQLAKNTEQIKKNTQAKKKNTSAGKKNESQATRTSAALGKLPALLAKIRVGLGLISFAGKTALASIAVPAATLAGWTYLLKRFSDGEREISNAARAIQVSVDYYKSLGLVANDAGLSIDNLSDLHEELVNRIGDAKENMKGASGTAFSILGLDPRDLENMSRTESFMKTVSAIQKSNLSDMAKIRLGDELFGGEGNRFLTYLVETNTEFSTSIEKYKSLVKLSNEASKSSKEFSTGFRNVTSVLSSLVLEGLNPVFEELNPVISYFTHFLVNNKKQVIGFVRELGSELSNAIYHIANFLSYMVSWLVDNRKSIFRWSRVVFEVVSKVTLAIASLINVLLKLDEITKGYSTTALLVIGAMLLFKSTTKFIIVKLFSLAQILVATVIPAMWGYVTAIAGSVAAMLPMIALITVIVGSIWYLYKNKEKAFSGIKLLWEALITSIKTATTPLLVLLDLLKATVLTVWDVFANGGKNVAKIWGDTFRKISSRVDSVIGKMKEYMNTVKALTGSSLEDLESSNNPEAKALVANFKRNQALKAAQQNALNSSRQARNLSTTSRVTNSTNTTNNTTNSGGNNINVTIHDGDPEKLKQVLVEGPSNF
jgi:hypothetical protein